MLSLFQVFCYEYCRFLKKKAISKKNHTHATTFGCGSNVILGLCVCVFGGQSLFSFKVCSHFLISSSFTIFGQMVRSVTLIVES